MNRDAVVRAICATLAQELESIERVAAMARDEVASEESKQESKYDTRATEASYLARGQAWRIAELRQIASWFDRLDPLRPASEAAGLGSLVHVTGHRDAWLFLAPIGGPRVQLDGQVVRVISPESPLGGALMGLEQDEAFEINSPQGRVEYEVVVVR
jgi:hypothetical protein